MVTHDAWALVCRLFAGGTPVLRATLSPCEASALSVLGKAVKPTVADQSFVLCPHCQQHRAQLWGDGRGGRMCRCPDCGPVPVEVNDGAALALDEEWLRTKLRLALGIESRDGIDDLGGGVWRLGDARRSPVVLARDLMRVQQEPALLDRVRVAGGGDIRVITPRPGTTRGSPFGAGVEWMALEERFTFYGGGITFIATSPSATPAVADPAMPVNGPFSADFRWATLPDVQATPIQFTQGQAKVFEALWSFKGVEMDGERVMQRADQKSDKPTDLFKIKAKNKGSPLHEARLAAYGALVVTQQRAGLYAMPCAAVGKEEMFMTWTRCLKRLGSRRLQEPVPFNFWSIAMSGKNQWVVPVNGGDQWGVRGEGNDRLTSIHDTQQQAIDRARDIAINQQSEMFIQGRDGQIRERNSYGHDPFPPKG